MRNLLDESRIAQRLDGGDRLMGRLRSPRKTSLYSLARAPQEPRPEPAANGRMHGQHQLSIKVLYAAAMTSAATASQSTRKNRVVACFSSIAFSMNSLFPSFDSPGSCQVAAATVNDE
jgi:hypothetical protein